MQVQRSSILGSTSAVIGMLLGFIALLLMLRRLARSCRNYLINRAHSCRDRPSRVHPSRSSASPEQAELEQPSSTKSPEPRRRARLAQLDFKGSQQPTELEAKQSSIDFSEVSSLTGRRSNSPSWVCRSSSAARSPGSTPGKKSAAAEAGPQTDREASLELSQRPSIISSVWRVAIKTVGSMISDYQMQPEKVESDAPNATPVNPSPFLSIEPQADSASTEAWLISSSVDSIEQRSSPGYSEKPSKEQSAPERGVYNESGLSKAPELESGTESGTWRSSFFEWLKLEVPGERLVKLVDRYILSRKVEDYVSMTNSIPSSQQVLLQAPSQPLLQQVLDQKKEDEQQEPKKPKQPSNASTSSEESYDRYREQRSGRSPTTMKGTKRLLLWASRSTSKLGSRSTWGPDFSEVNFEGNERGGLRIDDPRSIQRSRARRSRRQVPGRPLLEENLGLTLEGTKPSYSLSHFYCSLGVKGEGDLRVRRGAYKAEGENGQLRSSESFNEVISDRNQTCRKQKQIMHGSKSTTQHQNDKAYSKLGSKARSLSTRSSSRDVGSSSRKKQRQRKASTQSEAI